jgi:hypothetical protein
MLRKIILPSAEFDESPARRQHSFQMEAIHLVPADTLLVYITANV